MAKKKKKYIAKIGGNLSDGSRFEVGDVLDNLSPEDEKALIEMECLKENGDTAKSHIPS